MSRKFFNFSIIFLKIGPLRPRRRFSLAKQEKVWHNKCSVKRCPPESISRSAQAHNFIFGDVPKRLKGPHSKCGRRLKSAREFESLHLRQKGTPPIRVVFLFGGGLLRKLILRGNRKAGGTRLCRVQRVEKVFSPR